MRDTTIASYFLVILKLYIYLLTLNKAGIRFPTLHSSEIMHFNPKIIQGYTHFPPHIKCIMITYFYIKYIFNILLHTLNRYLYIKYIFNTSIHILNQNPPTKKNSTKVAKFIWRNCNRLNKKKNQVSDFSDFYFSSYGHFSSFLS